MVHPGLEKCQKRKRDSNVPLQVVDCTPLQLWAWWNDMGLIEQDIIFKYLGFLTRIMQVEPKRDVIEALLSFWNPTNNVFYFSNFEMTPTLEEITGFTGFGVRLHHQRLIAPMGISINKFFQHLNICKVKEKSLDKGWISLQFLYDRYGREDRFKKFGRTLNNKGSFETWKEHICFAFMWRGSFRIEAITLQVMPKGWRNTGVRKGGVQPYVLLRVLRQLGRRQVLPITENMKDFMSEVGPKVPLPEGFAQKIWDGCLVMGIGTMVKERYTGETHPEYSNWLEQQPRLQVRPERSVNEPIDQEAEMKIKIESAMRDYLAENQELRANLELARAALTQQQAVFEEERAKATQRETLLRGQVDLATIRGAQVAELAVSRQQQLRTCDQKNDFTRNSVNRRGKGIKTTNGRYVRSLDEWTSSAFFNMRLSKYNMPSFIQVSTNDPIYPPGFGPYANTSNVAGTSTVRPLSTPMMNNPLFMPTAPTNIIPQSTMMPNNDPPSKVHHDHGYTLVEAIKIPSSYPHIHKYSSPIEVEKTVKNEEHEEMAKKMKSLEQSIRDMQGLGSHKGTHSTISRSSLANTRKKTTENFREYAFRWREQAARVKPPMKESEMIDVLLQAQEPDYFHCLLSAVGKTFAEVIKVGEIVENGIKSGKIRCWYLKKTIQDLIDTYRIIVESPNGTNINQNPLPRHTETNMLEMMNGWEKVAVPNKPILKIGTGIENSANVVDLTKMMPSEAERRSESLNPLNSSILTVKGALEDVRASHREASLVVPRGPNKLILVVQGAHIPHVIIKPVSQLPMTNPKAVPWNYEPTIVTYKGKKVNEEVDEVGEITRSGRCYAPTELRKTKNDQMQVKSPVTEGEAEEFLRKMKLSDHSIVEQLRKTPAQISLLSLLIHSNEHRKAVMKILNETHVPNKVTVRGLSVYKDSSLPFIKANNENEALVYQAFEVVVVEHILEGNLISKPQLPMASVMMVNEMLKHGFEPGKGLGIFLQGRAYPVSPRKSLGTFDLGYEPRVEDKMKAKKQKRDVWSLTKPIPPIYKSFIKARTIESSESPLPEPVMEVNKELINYFQDLFVEADMVELGEGTSDRDVLFIGPDVQLNKWEATPLPVKNGSW
ncbi:hypothetical protein KY289_037842 [Solanum tuberosum]|nr:hypothetical protein KY289_037842 [Solanum tuberosum]